LFKASAGEGFKLRATETKLIAPKQQKKGEEIEGESQRESPL